MKCPHCQTELRYRDRPNRTCSNCKQEFALEPRTNAFKLHDLGLRDLLIRLSHNGRIRITSEQVLGAALHRWHGASGPSCLFSVLLLFVILFACYGFLILFSVLSSLFNIFDFILFILLIFIIPLAGKRIRNFWSMLRQRHDHDPNAAPQYPAARIRHSDELPSVDDFEDTILRPLVLKYGRPPWLIMNDEALALAAMPPLINPKAVTMAVVCPSASVRAFIVANELPQRFGMIALPPVVSAAHEPWLRVVRERRVPVYVLHEASLQGCLLVRDVYQLWQLPVDHPVIDLGINPHDILEVKKPLLLKVKTDKKLVNKVMAFTQLKPIEVNWLTQGNVAPLYGLPPARLLAILIASGKAGQTGFMSWPKAA